jgi:hypothetical protein
MGGVDALRKVPHVWAFTGKSAGRLLIAFAPAGKMQRFFETLTSGGNTRQDAELLRDHDMEFVGPPLQV